MLALDGGVCVDLSQMNQVLRVSVDDLDATVQAGVTHRQLNKHLANTGLTFFVDPGADATLGGMAATGASGTTAVRYGTMRENVRGLTVVLADGRVITTGGRARKSSAGYDLTRLFVGSEGTLGIISEVTRAAAAPARSRGRRGLRLPEHRRGGQDRDRDDPARRVPVARIELLDEVQMDAINRFSRLDYPVLPTLFFEFHGHTEREVGDQAETVQALAAEHERRRLHVGDASRGSGASLARPARLVLRVAGAPPWRQGLDDRRLRADLAPGRLHRRVEARPRGVVPDRHPRRPRRRRQLPHAVPGGPGRMPRRWPKPAA